MTFEAQSSLEQVATIMLHCRDGIGQVMSAAWFPQRAECLFHQSREFCFSSCERASGAFWKTPTYFYWGVALVWPLYDTYLIAEMVGVLGRKRGATVGGRQRKTQQGGWVRRHRERQKCRNVEKSKESVWTTAHKGRYYEEKENRHIVWTREQVEVMRPVASEVDSNCSRERTRLWVILNEVYMNSSVQVTSPSVQSCTSNRWMLMRVLHSQKSWI